jgi:hypothetical protein
MKVNIQMQIIQSKLQYALLEATNDCKHCSNDILDAVEELKLYYSGKEEYELAQVVKEFKMELVKKSGFLAN